MKKFIKNLRLHLSYNKIFYLLIIGVVAVGFIFGLVFYFKLSDTHKQEAVKYIDTMLANFTKENLYKIMPIFNNFIKSALFILLIWLLGISVVGSFIIIILLFYKSFVFGYSLLFLLKVQGFNFIFFYFIVVFVLKTLIYIVISVYSMNFSLMIGNSIVKKRTLQFNKFFKKYSIVLAFSIALILFVTIYENIIIPLVIS